MGYIPELTEEPGSRLRPPGFRLPALTQDWSSGSPVSAPLGHAVALHSGPELIAEVTLDACILEVWWGRPAVGGLPCDCFQMTVINVCCAIINVL